MNQQLLVKCHAKDHLSIDELTPLQGQLKNLTNQNYEKFKKQLLELGFSAPFFVWKDNETNYIGDGHMRLYTLKQMRDEGIHIPDQLPVVYFDAKDKKEAKKKVLAFTSQYGEMTIEGLSDFAIDGGIEFNEIVESFRFPEIDLNDFAIDDVAQGLTDEDEVPNDVEPRSKLGDIWKLGEHRLMCGDSTDAESVALLMNGEKADITFTSPPYNLGNNAELRGYNGDGDESVYNEKSDHKSQDEYLEFLIKWTSVAIQHSTNVFSNIQILAGNKFVMSEYWNHFKNNLVDLMIWDKEHAQPSAARRVLNSVWEFIFIFTKENFPKRSIKTGKDFLGTIPNIYRLNPVGKKDPLAKDHGAVFPVQFAEYFVEKFSENSVLDLFGGSGSTLIACEKTGRKCFMMELDPHYCDVIVERWQIFTGKTSEHIGNVNEK